VATFAARVEPARLSEHNVTLWCCEGFGHGPGEARRRFHITTTDLHEASFPALRVVIGRGFHHASPSTASRRTAC
jgi:hypothetical protein